MLPIDYYAYQNRWRHLDGRLKFLLFLLFLIISFSGIWSLQVALFITVFWLTFYLARIPFAIYVRLYFYPTIFILLSLATLLLSVSITPLSYWVGWSFGSLHIGILPSAPQQVIRLGLRIYACLAATYFFVLTTPFGQILKGLHRSPIPRELLDLILLMYRFLFLLMGDFISAQESLVLKFAFSKKGKRIKGLAYLANSVFLRLVDHQKQLEEILELRFDAMDKEGTDVGDSRY
ncbi:cobalt ABC transporter permease [Streptococcus danieliae]|uniref:Cobalt ABC transporter permease n=1 Tax=Streptococcus danieliae TaxID=747656 RepID=A0A7X3KB06_9STRE|nr:CbiQ family ECF transporter T component [Streptococcus danieliae]MVX58091.1 cobalt ABC transporter permease [Streptococcus danieliae]